MTDEPVAVACPRDTNQKHLRFGAKQIRLERSNTTLAVSDGTLDRLKRLLLTFRDKPLRESPGKRQDENCCARYEAIHSNDGGPSLHALPCKCTGCPAKAISARRLTSSDNNKLACVGRFLDARPQSEGNNAIPLDGCAMRETNGLVKIPESGEVFDTAQITKTPITWSITAKVAPQTPSEFESVLLAIAGHDLRQPLQVIQGVHDFLGLGVRTASESRLLRAGRCAIDRLKDQLDQLLAAIRLREHAEGAKLTPVSIGPLFRQVRHEHEIAALRKGVSVRTVQTTATIQSNAILLSAVLRNLVSNAIKYTDPGGRILVGCRHVGESIRIDVYDTGIGITADQMPRIFEAFTRLDPVRRDGLGVGLFIVRQAIGLLGYRVDINSAPSQGTRFSIFAPRAEKAAVQPRQAGSFRETMFGAQP